MDKIIYLDFSNNQPSNNPIFDEIKIFKIFQNIQSEEKDKISITNSTTLSRKEKAIERMKKLEKLRLERLDF
jgi:hypothetical protein